MDNLPHLNNIEALHGESHIKDSIVSAQQEQRQAKSEHGSPDTGPSSLEQLNSQLSPLDLPASESYPDFGFHLSLDNYNILQDIDQPIFSAGLSATSIDWSHYDGLDFNNENFATSDFSQAPSFTGFDFSGMEQPALTSTSTSGEISEVEDAGMYMDVRHSHTTQPPTYGSDYNSEMEENEFYRFGTASSSYTGVQGQMISNNVSSLDLDELLKCASTGSYLDNINDLPVGTFADNKFVPTAFDASFMLPHNDDDTAWMASFVPSQIAHNPSVSEPNDQRVWDQ